MPLQPSAVPQTAELTIVAPCFNERDNVRLLVEKLEEALKGIAWEIIFVDDDSPDGTASVARELAQTNAHVRCLQRIGRRGLSTAVIEGMLASSAPYLAVIDADLQHDETLLPKMLQHIRTGDVDVVVGSRYVAGGDVGNWDTTRASMSAVATKLSKLIVRENLSDPMSGFFMITRPTLEKSVRRLSGQGFKILLDIFASTSQPLLYRGLPYSFRVREFGESKLDTFILWEYLTLLMDKLIGWLIPVRFFMFSLVGVTGVIVHLAILRATLDIADFMWSQAFATVVAMTSNFFINNILTYRDRRLTGSAVYRGLLRFYAVCGFGAAANVGIAASLFGANYSWLLSGIAGIFVSVVWNYAVSGFFVWNKK